MAVRALLFLGLLALATEGKKSRHHRDFTSSPPEPPTSDPDTWNPRPTLADTADEETILTQENPCLVKYCGKGMECVLGMEGRAKCICQRRCPRYEKLICGSDGIVYRNYCELHRTACVETRRITVDHSFNCSKSRRKGPPNHEGKNNHPTTPPHSPGRG